MEHLQKPQSLPLRHTAGGVVARINDNTVYIALAVDLKRPGLVLPKGGIEPGESPLDAARREIAEETGLTKLQLLGELGVRERASFKGKHWVRTIYYLFLTTQTDAHPLERRRYLPPEWHPIHALPPMLWPEQAELIETHRDRIVSAVLSGDALT